MLADPREDAGAFLAGLEGLLQREPHSVLLPSSDLSLWLISENRQRFQRLVRLPLSDRAAVAMSLDKASLIKSARDAGLAPPPSAVCTDQKDGIAAAQELGFPLVLKPSRSFQPSGSKFLARPVALVEDEAELAGALPEFQPPFVVQRFEPGRTIVSCAGLMVGERLVATAVVRWLRRWPVETGATTFCETIVPPPGVVAKVESLLASIRFQGIFELEMLDLGGNRFAAIDLNPRLFGWLALPISAGLNLPALLCDSLYGANARARDVPPGMRYRWEDGDLRHLVWQLSRGHVGAAAAVLRPHRRVVHAHFKASDPAPLVARAAYMARLWTSKGRRRQAGTSGGRSSPAIANTVDAASRESRSLG
jgi:predicted ATP-grasp superfamily ATP-dependent carboligase